jgi:beta-glucosidase
MAIFERVPQAPYELLAISPGQRWPTRKLRDDLNSTEEIPAGRPDLLVSTVQINTQQDAKLLRWQGPARLVAWSPPALLSAYPDAALLFDLRLMQAPSGAVGLGMDCGEGCGGRRVEFDLRPLLRPLAPGDRLSLKIPLACFAALGMDLDRVEQPFVLSADAPFAAAIAHIRVQAGAARHGDALRCEQLQPLTSATP